MLRFPSSSRNTKEPLKRFIKDRPWCRSLMTLLMGPEKENEEKIVVPESLLRPAELAPTKILFVDQDLCITHLNQTAKEALAIAPQVIAGDRIRPGASLEEILSFNSEELNETTAKQGTSTIEKQFGQDRVMFSFSKLEADRDKYFNYLVTWEDTNLLPQSSPNATKTYLELQVKLLQNSLGVSNIDSALAAAVDTVYEVLNAEFGSVWLHSCAFDELVNSYFTGHSDYYPPLDLRLVRGQGFPGRVWVQRKLQLQSTKDFPFNEPRSSQLWEADIHYLLGFPVIIHKRLHAVLEFGFQSDAIKESEDLISWLGLLLSNYVGTSFSLKRRETVNLDDEFIESLQRSLEACPLSKDFEQGIANFIESALDAFTWHYAALWQIQEGQESEILCEFGAYRFKTKPDEIYTLDYCAEGAVVNQDVCLLDDIQRAMPHAFLELTVRRGLTGLIAVPIVQSEKVTHIVEFFTHSGSDINIKRWNTLRAAQDFLQQSLGEHGLEAEEL